MAQFKTIEKVHTPAWPSGESEQGLHAGKDYLHACRISRVHARKRFSYALLECIQERSVDDIDLAGLVQQDAFSEQPASAYSEGQPCGDKARDQAKPRSGADGDP